MNLNEADKPKVTKTIVVYSGRFQPFHKGHYATYQKLCSKFGANNVYIGTSNDTSSAKSPFNFNEKKKIVTTMFGVPASHFLQVSNPYAPKEILSKFDEKTTQYVAAVGEKDADRLHGKYFKPYNGKAGYGYKEIGYVYPVPAEQNPISRTDVRNGLGSDDVKKSKDFFLKAYPKFDKDIFKMITTKLNEGFPGGIGVGLNLPGGYINGAPTGSIDKNENLYDPIGNLIDRTFAEEIFEEFLLEYLNEEPNAALDRDISYTNTKGQQKKIKARDALRLPKEHPAHIQAAKIAGPDDAPANEPKKKEQPGKAATQAATPSQPGQPVKKGQTTQGKIDKGTSATPQSGNEPEAPNPQKLSGTDMKTDAEKTNKEKNSEHKAKFLDKIKNYGKKVRQEAEKLWDDFSKEEQHDAHEVHDANSKTRKSWKERSINFIKEIPKNIAKASYTIAKAKTHQLKNTGRGIQSLVVSASKGEKPKFGMYKDRDGKWQHSETEAKRQRKACLSTVKDVAITAAAVVAGGALGGAIGHIVGGHGAGSLGSALSHGAADVFHHGAGGFASHAAVDFAKHCGWESLGLATGASHASAEVGAAGAALAHTAVASHFPKIASMALGAIGLSEAIDENDEIKQNSDLFTNMLKEVLERMQDFQPSPEQMLATMHSYSKVKEENQNKEKADNLKSLLNPINEEIESKTQSVNEFVKWACGRLKLKEEPKVTILSKDYSNEVASLGGYSPETKEIYAVGEGRMMADILRTIAHELVHRKQDEMGLIGSAEKDGKDGSPIENQAHAVAGILMREYGRKNKQIFNEDVNVDVDKGDEILTGKFKNKKTTVKDIGTDDHGMPTINGRQATTFRTTNEVGSNDWHFKAIMKMWDKASSFSRKKIGVVVCNTPNATRDDVARKLRGYGYKEVTYVTDKLGLDESNSLNDLQKQRMVLYTKAFKMMPNSPAQLKVRVDIDRLSKEIERLEKKNIKEKLSHSNLNSIEKYADRELSPADIQFSNHFFDRVNDTRNGKEISEPELTGFFKRLARHKKQFLDFLNKYNQIVVKDTRSDINIPFVKMANKVIAKTVMRKGEFKTSSPTIVNETTPSEVIKDLDKVRNDLIKKVDVLIAKKKKLYSNVDIESPMSADEKKLDKDIQSIFSQIQQLIQQKRSLKKESLNEGGAYGHMSHPFDDMDLTFGDLKNIIKGALTGNLELTREKTDGQALAISWKNGRLIAARNKGHLANAGANAMGIEDVAFKFGGRGGLTDAYNFAMKDLTAAISGLSKAQKDKIFNEGKCFMNLEVIWPTSVNVIPYGQPLLVFHNTTCYDEKGVAVGADQSAARILAGMIKQTNGNVQSKYTIQGPPVTELPKNEDLSSKQSSYITRLQKLQFEFQLSDKDNVANYHQAWWDNFITKNAPKGIDKLTQQSLVKRWAFGDKSFRLNTISNPEVQKWATEHDKVNVAKQQKDNIRPFEEIFLGVGADVLSFMSSVLTANPDAAVRSMKEKLKSVASQVRTAGNPAQIAKLKSELARLQSIGGKGKIVPNEGIVFVYKGNTYKLTGTFAPLNQILGIFYA